MKKSFLLVLLFTQTLFAQLTDDKYLDTYKSAVDLFNQEKFEEATLKFSPLTTKKFNNGIAPYAFMYHAISADKKGSKYQSKVLFRNLLTYYPEWDKINEARLIFGQISLTDGYIEEGIKTLHEIDDKKYNAIRLQLISEHIDKVKTIAGLKIIYEKYPNYEPIAKALVGKIQTNRYNTKADLELSDELSNRFNFFGGAINEDAKSNNSKKNKSEINLALLLPFEIQQATSSNLQLNYVYEIYAGIQLAAEEISKKGIDVNILPFDIRNNANDFKKASSKKNFNNLDIIVGPLYASSNDLAKEFISTKNTIQIHPLSNNLSLVQNVKNSFLMQPSQVLQSQKSLEYIKDLGLNNTVSIFYGNSRKDSTFAALYAAEAKKKGFTITSFRKFVNQDIKPTTGHIFFAGDDSQGIKFLQNCALNNVNSEILITASSFNWERLDHSIFTPNISIIYPEYVDQRKESVVKFGKDYYNKYFIAPSYYAYLGYDLGLYFLGALKDGRNMFEINLKHGGKSDKFTLTGYDYSDKIKQNTVVPIVKYKEDNFEEVYR